MGDPPETPEDDAPPGPHSEDASGAPSQRPSLPSGARCASHPDAPATGVCARCGNYMCPRCSLGGAAEHCGECRDRGAAQFPFTRDNYSLDGLLNISIERFKEHWTPLVAATLVMLVIVYGVAFLFSFVTAFLPQAADAETPGVVFFVVAGFGQFLQLLVQWWMYLGLFAICLQALRGREPQLSALLSELRRLPAALLQLLVIYAVLLLYVGAVGGASVLAATGDDEVFSWQVAAAGAALGFVPIAYALTGLMYSMMILVDDPQSTAIGAMRRSWQISSGKRWSMIGTFIVSVLVGMAGILACCVGMLATLPLSTMIYAALYLALSNDGSREPI